MWLVTETVFFRSVSFSLFGSENWHVELRLLCVSEVLTHRSFYDTDHADFYPPFKADMWLQLPSFGEFVCSLVQLNSYCDMLAVLAASSVTHKAIQTLWPIPVEPGQLSPFTKLVFGREIAMCRHPLQIMWTVSTYCNAMPDHFVPLIERADKAPETVIVVDDTEQNTPITGIGCADRDPEDELALDDADPSKESSETVQNTPPSSNDCSVELPTVTLGTPLPSSTYLSLSACISTLDSADESTLLTNVPTGVKSNVYFVVSTQENDNRILTGQRRVFHDDCGAWVSTRGFNSVVVGGSPKELFEMDGLVCDRKRVNGKDQLLPVEPQPNPECVRKVSRYYYKLKRCDTYKKRITMLSGCKAYLCEYIGTFPDDVNSHGNSLSAGTQYIRTRPEVLATIKEKCTTTKQKPNQTYTAMSLKAADEFTCPRNLKQVQNVSASVNGELVSNQKRGTNNLADEMQSLCSLVTAGDFVRSVCFTSEHAPCVIMYTDEQLSDVKRFCGSDAPDNIRSVLCVDRTFNVSSLFLTLTVFKNNSVLRCNTMRPPIFIGPMFLHGDGQYITYLQFFYVSQRCSRQ